MSDTTTDSRPYTYGFTVSREACDALLAMGQHVERLAAYWGPGSPEHLKASESFTRQVTTLFARPWAAETRVGRDGDLSLVVNAGLMFGLIWHGDRRSCTDEACGAVVNDDGTVWTYDRHRNPVLDHDHTLTYPLDAPQPGTWSFHS